MRNNSRSFMFFLMLIAVMLMSAVGSYPVYADEGTPADVSGEETVSEPADEGTPADVSAEESVSEPADEGTPADASGEETVSEPADEGTADVSGEETISQPADEGTADVSGEESVSQPADEGTPADASTTEAAPEPSDVGEQVPAETVAEILEQVPEETDVIVVVDGVIEPMTTVVAAQAIATNDPWWCPGTGAPSNVLTGDCTTGAGSGAYSAFTGTGGLIAWMLTTATSGGTIWIVDTYDSSTELSNITIDGSAWTNSVPTGFLTIQGGWDGNDDSLG
ncbi:MAG: hypothetical protein MUO77_16720, partial [Anaerolineales bacterium]|nr:hypothetical protein [Anaerolineales bacterium]